MDPARRQKIATFVLAAAARPRGGDELARVAAAFGKFCDVTEAEVREVMGMTLAEIAVQNATEMQHA